MELSAVMLWAGPWRQQLHASHHPNRPLPTPSAHPDKNMWDAQTCLKNALASIKQALRRRWGLTAWEEGGKARKSLQEQGAGKRERGNRDSRKRWLTLLDCHLNYPWQKNSD